MNVQSDSKQAAKELARLEALYETQLLDSGPDPDFDNIAELARGVFDVSVALVSLVDRDRQWFKANLGLEGTPQTPRDVAFCDYAVQLGELLVVEDASSDPRFAENPLVTGAPNIRFYAGAPLVTDDGHMLGTLCIIDFAPRKFSDREAANLARMASMVMKLINKQSVARKSLDQAEKLHRYAAMTELVLAESHIGVARYKAVRDAAGKIIDFRVLYLDASSSAVVKRTPEDVIGMSAYELFPQAAGSESELLLQEVADTGESVVRELVLNIGGIEFWSRMAVVLSAPDELSIAYVNLSEHKAFEEALTELHDLTPMMAADNQAYLQKVLEVGERVFGVDAGVVLSKTSGAVQTHARTGDVGAFDTLFTDEAVSALCAFIRQDARPVMIEDMSDPAHGPISRLAGAGLGSALFCPIFDHGEVSAAVCFLSKSPRRRPFKKFKREILSLIAGSISHALSFRRLLQNYRDVSDELRLVLDNVPARIWYKDDKNTILRANRAALISVNLTDPAEVEGKPTEDLFPDMAAKYLTDDLEVINRGEPVRNIIESYAPKQGAQGWISTDKIPMTSASGQKTILAVATDITAEHNMREQLKRANDSLSNFAFVAAHDLQAPLRQTAMFLDLLRSDLEAIEGALDDERGEFLDEAMKAVARMRKMVKSLYDLYRLDDAAIEIAPCDLRQTIETAANQALATSQSCDVHIEVEDMPRLNLNESLIVQLFQNLIYNSCKYADVDDLKVRIYATRNIEKRRLNIMVEDNGVGIPEDARDQIFEPFKRLHHGGDVPGAGIGLALCRRIAALHHADLYVDPDYEDGARFVLSFHI